MPIRLVDGVETTVGAYLSHAEINAVVVEMTLQVGLKAIESGVTAGLPAMAGLTIMRKTLDPSAQSFNNQLSQAAEGSSSDDVVDVEISKKKYPESAGHIEAAQQAGQPKELTLDRKNAAKRRREALRKTNPKEGFDRDEYPPAMSEEGGSRASVDYVNPSDNRGAGACIGAQCRKVPDGKKVRVNVVP